MRSGGDRRRRRIEPLNRSPSGGSSSQKGRGENGGACREALDGRGLLAWDDDTDRRYELVDGKIVEIGLQPEAHGTIMANLAAILHRGVPRPCRALIRAGVVPAHRDATYYQADLLVTCAPPEPGRSYPVDPVLIVEVLSPSTEVHDRGRKVEDYSRLPSVNEILLVSSEERRVRSWRRDGTAGSSRT